MILSILGYCVTVTFILTYVWAASGRSLTPNLWVNLIGGPIVALGNSFAGYWPAVILEVFITIASAYGLLRLWWQRPTFVWPRTPEEDCPPWPHSHNGIGTCGTDPATW